jgi:putative membrane protein
MSDRSLKDYMVISLKGLAMGAADVVPGVSGGTIAFITGIYEELVTTISNIDFGLIKAWKTGGFLNMWNKLNGNFLLALLTGIAISIFSLMKLMSFLLDTYPILVWSFFFGLVLASVWYIGKQIPKWKLIHYVGFILATAVAYLITSLTPAGETQSLIYLFFCGSLASCAMILPGISGAFILVLLGAYKQIIDAVSNFDIKVFVVVALGAIVGILSFSRLLKWLFKKHEYITLSILTGFVFGSLNKIWPWKQTLSVINKESGNTVDFSSISNLINLNEYQKVTQDSETYKIVIEKSISPLNYSDDPQLLFPILLALVGFLTIFMLEKWSVKKA